MSSACRVSLTSFLSRRHLVFFSAGISYFSLIKVRCILSPFDFCLLARALQGPRCLHLSAEQRPAAQPMTWATRRFKAVCRRTCASASDLNGCFCEFAFFFPCFDSTPTRRTVCDDHHFCLCSSSTEPKSGSLSISDLTLDLERTCGCRSLPGIDRLRLVDGSRFPVLQTNAQFQLPTSIQFQFQFPRSTTHAHTPAQIQHHAPAFEPAMNSPD